MSLLLNHDIHCISRPSKLTTIEVYWVSLSSPFHNERYRFVTGLVFLARLVIEIMAVKSSAFASTHTFINYWNRRVFIN